MERRNTIWPGRVVNQPITKRSHEEDPATTHKVPKLQNTATTGDATIKAETDQRKLSMPRALSLSPFQRLTGDPWKQDYHRLMWARQGGEVMISYGQTRPQKLVAVRQLAGCNEASFAKLKGIVHEHLLSFSAAYFFEDSVFFIYEVMNVCLSDIVNTPLGPLLPKHIVQICICVLKGLQYIHDTLDNAHGELKASNVLLNRSGNVKLARVGEILLYRESCEKKEDLEDVGYLLCNMLEPELLQTDEIPLRLQRGHDQMTQSFFEETQNAQTCQDLLRHSYLDKAQGTHWLAPVVYTAEVLQSQPVKIPPSVLATHATI